MKKIAVIGRMTNTVHLDWYSGIPPYQVTPLEGIKNSAGSNVEVIYAANKDQAAEIAGDADVAVVFIGNHPTCHNIGWAKSPYPSEGREGLDRQTITLEPHDLEPGLLGY